MELIKLQQHDDQWAAIFKVEQQKLFNVLAHHVAEIHHVGSTAVPDLLAKPIIDIAIEANTFPPSQAIIDQLATIDYEYKGEAGIEGRHWFIKGHPRTFNLHYCAIRSEVVTNQLKLRDKLIENESFRRDYERIKLENLTNKDIDSSDYALAKSDFIQKVITSNMAILDTGELIRTVTTNYANFLVAEVNDHVVRLSVMTEPYFWHYHPNSDETFMTVEGVLIIELETETIELLPGQLVTIPKNVAHRTLPKGERSVNITFEHSQIETVRIDH